MKRVINIGAILLVSVALAAGCGGGSEHNAQDVTFAKDMVPHHQQAVLMADLAQTQAGSGAVKDLAARIKAAQGPEISTMNGWLSSWGESATNHEGHDTGGMDMGGGPQGSKDPARAAGMRGMVSELDLNRLRGATGPQFDRLFLELMTAHHQGAIEMAKLEIEKGKFEPAKALAGQIVGAQEKEIAEMATLLRGVPA